MGNKCPGGFKSRKRAADIPIERAIEEWEQFALVSCGLLPAEVWEYILLYLRTNGKVLLKCRRICRLWKELADTMLERNYALWGPVFPHIATVPIIFVGGFGEVIARKVSGTKITSAHALREFMEDMDYNFQSEDQLFDNPFPNRTVLLFTNSDLCVPSKRPRPGYYRELPTLLEKFGKHIWSMEYLVRDDTPESMRMLRNFFHLTSLKSLTIFARDWNKKRIRTRLAKIQNDIALRQQQGDKFLENLTDLQILGCNGIIPMNYIFASIGLQLKSLYLCFFDEACNIAPDGTISSMGATDGFHMSEMDPDFNQALLYSLNAMTPNLVNLKLYEVNDEIVDRMFPNYGRRLSALRVVSVKMQRPYLRTLNRFIKALDRNCARTLRVLHLEISRWPTFDNENPDLDRDVPVYMDPQVIYPVLTDLTISYALFLHTSESLFKFAVKCPVLKVVTFVSVNIHSGEFPDFVGFCKPLWNRLPRSVEKVMVRFWITLEPCPGPFSTNKASKAKLTEGNRPLVSTQTCYRPPVVVAPRRRK